MNGDKVEQARQAVSQAKAHHEQLLAEREQAKATLSERRVPIQATAAAGKRLDELRLQIPLAEVAHLDARIELQEAMFAADKAAHEETKPQVDALDKQIAEMREKLQLLQRQRPDLHGSIRYRNQAIGQLKRERSALVAQIQQQTTAPVVRSLVHA